MGKCPYCGKKADPIEIKYDKKTQQLGFMSSIPIFTLSCPHCDIILSSGILV